MSFSTIFQVVNSLALLAWFPMFFIPKRKWTIWWVQQKYAVSILAFLYLIFFLIFIFLPVGGNSAPSLDFSSFAGIKALFQSEQAILIGWLHYLVFDLLAGCYIFEQAKKQDMPHILVVIMLIFTFMLGPVGWLFYLSLSTLRRSN